MNGCHKTVIGTSIIFELPKIGAIIKKKLIEKINYKKKWKNENNLFKWRFTQDARLTSNRIAKNEGFRHVHFLKQSKAVY